MTRPRQRYSVASAIVQHGLAGHVVDGAGGLGGGVAGAARAGAGAAGGGALERVRGVLPLLLVRELAAGARTTAE